ncbi:mitochondrial fission ELM1 family protein [Nisaea acidiphila]|uniref:Mitochondrial fission ELM1 family protein n=1 Tax=Nisaea acidiphila TaxID=1862145 RepID=A0A9J7AW34_9PROT|nr:mitochondrial fission ELM1 family protein [Nisaea acidiphila]UUX51567.1 mitochondrial fission ELM1 family protein [Nisaea acidiphila]
MSLPAGATAWIVSDGTRGMEVQSLALARALGLDPVVKRIRPAPWLRAFPSLGCCRAVPSSAGGDTLAPPWPDLVIGCGRRNAGAVLSIKARSRGRSFAVQIQDPRLDPALFDALVVPEHDPVRGANVVLTTGSLNGIFALDLKNEAKRFEDLIGKLPTPRVLVSVGGPTRRSRVDPALADRFAENLKRLMDSGGGLMMTTSRRTPDHLVRALRELADDSESALLWNGEGENPYLGFLGAADTIVVTSDSVNMTSEACSTGKGVYVADLLRPSGRIGIFQRTLPARGLTRPFSGEAAPFAYDPLRDAELAADGVRRLFAAAGR